MSAQQQEIQRQQHNQDIAHKILLAIKDLRFGSVEIIIHDSKSSRSNARRRSASTGTLHEPPNEQGECEPTVLLSELKENTVPSRQLEA